MSDEIADVLDDAADYIEQYGWGVGTSASVWEFGQPGCALAGIRAAEKQTHANDFYKDSSATQALNEVIPQGDPWDRALTHVSRIWSWNDSQRDPHPVLDALRAAAKQQRTLVDGE